VVILTCKTAAGNSDREARRLERVRTDVLVEEAKHPLPTVG
jgi:hypothetical protein